MRDYRTLDDLRPDGKTVILRLDVNSPIESGRIAGVERVRAGAETLQELSHRACKIIVLAHQGRKGDDDFTSLREHAELLARFSGVKTAFAEDVGGIRSKEAIGRLAAGEAVVLENVRGLEEETRKGSPDDHARAPFVATLAALAQAYVNDAFSASHRSHASLVGFPRLLPSAAGRALQRELDALDKACDNPVAPSVYFLGGAKPEDSLMVMEHNFRRGKLDLALLGGLVGELFLVARGHDLGPGTQAILEKKGVLKRLPEAEKLLDAFDEKIVTPEDVGVKTASGRRDVYIEELPMEEPVLDIGRETVSAYAAYIAEAGGLFLNGPAGAFEEKGFDAGTRGILKAFSASDAFSLLGGGHTVSAISHAGLKNGDFGYVSLGGGALMAYVAGEKLPAVEALRESKTRFEA